MYAPSHDDSSDVVTIIPRSTMRYDLARVQDTLNVLFISYVYAGDSEDQLTSILSSAVKPWM